MLRGSVQEPRVLPRALVVFLLLLVCYGYFLPRSGDRDWVATSRAALVYALVDQGTVRIDAYHEPTGDKAFYRGHYYIVGSVGPSLLGVPAYALFRSIASLARGDRRLQPGTEGYRRWALTWITLAVISVPSAALGALVFVFATQFVTRPGAAMAAALLHGLGTIAFPYSRAFYQHQVAAVGAFAGFYLIWEVARGRRSTRSLWGAGLLFGLAAICEYPFVIPLALIGAWAWRRVPRRGLYRVALGTLPPLLVSALYNLAAFGTPLPAGYRYHVVNAGAHAAGYMGMSTPSWSALYGITFSPYRGLFFLSPVLLLALPGLRRMTRGDDRERWLAALIAGLTVTCVLYNSAYVFWYGGASVGPRFLVPVLPFLAPPLAVAFERCWRTRGGRVVAGALAAASIANVWAQSIAGQYYPGADVERPLTEYALPRLRAGDVADNYGTLLGLSGWASIVPLVVTLAALGCSYLWLVADRPPIARPAAPRRLPPPGGRPG